MVKFFIVEAGELIKITLQFWVEAIDTFTEVTKLVESFGLVNSVL